MLTFIPETIVERIGVGEGISAAGGHSLYLDGNVWDGRLENAIHSKPRCVGNLRIQLGKPDDQKHVGLFQVRLDQTVYFSAVIFLSDAEFASARTLLITSDAAKVEIENQDHLSIDELAKEVAWTFEIVGMCIGTQPKRLHSMKAGQ